jgi:hydroxymethylglutaryl-CoA reductase
MLVMHLIVDVRDAMGANTVNTMAEAVSPLVEEITGGQVRLRILSNLADLRLSRARVALSPEASTAEYAAGRSLSASSTPMNSLSLTPTVRRRTTRAS